MTISKDRVKPSPLPDSWKLAEIFTTGIVLGSYLAMMTVIFFWAAYKTNFFLVSSRPWLTLVMRICLKFYFRLLICVHLNCVFMPMYLFWRFFWLLCDRHDILIDIVPVTFSANIWGVIP